MIIPAQGQIVQIRNRRFVVTDVVPSFLPTGPLGTIEKPQHQVRAASIEDDAFAEEIEVVWEIEPGTQVTDKLELPNPNRGFDDPHRLSAFLDAVRWGAASQADTKTLRAPFQSGIDIKDYQLEPLVRAIQMPRVNLLVADDVGLGKTIEAGLVCQELIIRHRVRRVLIVCPSYIQIQWQEQMRDKFGLDFKIADSTLMKELRRNRGLNVNPWSHFPRLITSIDFLKRERPQRLLKDTLPADGQPTYPRAYDLLILDEAHNAAPSRISHYAQDSLRTAAIRTLVPHVEHKLFLTATPHNGFPESFTALLELLDNQRFAQGVQPDKNQLNAVMVRRMKSELRGWDGSRDINVPERHLKEIEVHYTEQERQVHADLRAYTKLRIEHAHDESERYATEFVLKLLKKRLISSPAAFVKTLRQHEETLRNASRRTAASRPTVGLLRRQIEQIDEEYADDEMFDDATNDTLQAATSIFRAPSEQETRLLDSMRAWGERAEASGDSKLNALLEWMHQTIKPKGDWSDTRVIIFTEYRDTQKWLLQQFASAGFSEGMTNATRRLELLYGGMPPDDRERIKAAFQTSPTISPVRILLATDAASEGIDLQNYCSRLIHYEIPWNPNRMEQRNGRVDRYGQKEAEVQIFHFVGAGYAERLKKSESLKPGDLEGDLEFLVRAARKIEAIREDLGKVGPVIAAQVEDAMLGRRLGLDTAAAEISAEPVRRLLKLERKLRDQIAAFTQQLRETTEEMGFTPENIQSVVEVGLALAGKPSLRPLHDGLFEMPRLDGSWAACLNGIEHPHTLAVRPITFDRNVSEGRDDVVLVHLGHRLVQMCLRLLRAEIWAAEGSDGSHLHRVTACIIPDRAFDVPVLIAYGRLVILGTDGHRLHEEIVQTGGEIRDGKFSRLSARQVESILQANGEDPAPEEITQKLAALWPTHQRSVTTSLEARARDRWESLDSTLKKRAEEEAANITAILNELARGIDKGLAGSITDQLELDLFNDNDRSLLERNLAALRERRDHIPEEIKRETAAIEQRFQSPEYRLFPLALKYLVPERIARTAAKIPAHSHQHTKAGGHA